VSYTRIISTDLVLESKFGYTRYANHAESPNTGVDVPTQLGIPGNGSDIASSVSRISITTTRLAILPYVPIITKDNTFRELSNLIYTHGRHTVKIGEVQ
jgi:hypothetical protein